jgi:hypothetical protein
MKKKAFFCGFIVVLTALHGFVYGAHVIPAEERAALIALYNATAGDHWKNNRGWKTPPLHTDGFAMPGTELYWFGVTMYFNYDNIAEITLGDNNLQGHLPPELGNLSRLDRLILNNNQLSGPIPQELGNLSHLSTLNFSDNQLTGHIPPQLGNLTHLWQLWLKDNQLSGNIPAELGKLDGLVSLRLNNNRLSGNIAAALGDMDNLRYLYLQDNQLSGIIPTELEHLTLLQELHLHHNQLTGNIPPGFGHLQELSILDLNHNQLTGTIPLEFAALSVLDLSHNQLSGPIPPGFGNYTNMRYLHLNSNRLTGKIPAAFTNFMAPYRIIDLDLKYNGVYTDNQDLRFFLNEINQGWEETQTIAPTQIAALSLSPSLIRVSWVPILYQEDSGGYEIYYRSNPLAPWSYSGITGDKSAYSHIVTGLNPGTTYYFTIKTRTNPHANNQVTVISEPGGEVSAVTDTAPSTCTLTFRSNPQQIGVSIAVSPADQNGQTAGTPPFTRTYFKGTTVTLTAPATYGGDDFLKWTVDGLDNWNPAVEIAVYANHDITVFYGKSAVELTVTATEDKAPGSLRQILAAANSMTKDTTILLPAGTYFLSGLGMEDENRSGDLDIDTGHHITIKGEGAEQTVIDGSHLDRVLHIINGTVSISGVTVQNGKTRPGFCGSINEGNGEDGGGIYNSGILDLTLCRIQNNSTGPGDVYPPGGGASESPHGGRGGGIFNEGTLTLRNCIISNNQTGGGYSGGDGGGIANIAGKANLINCSIRDNGAGKDSGGQGGNGGGIYNTGDLTISATTIATNTAYHRNIPENIHPFGIRVTGGGGIFNEGRLTLYASTLSHNATGNASGGLSGCGDAGHGGGIYNRDTAILENCTISSNKTGNGGYCYSEDPPGTNGGNGGGIYSEGTLTITSSTICNNTTGSGGWLLHDCCTRSGFGGGIFIKAGIPTVKNTLIADNDVPPDSQGPDCYGTFNSHGYNLVENTDHCHIQGLVTGNITGQDPLLDILADNGGPTQTHALLSSSPALDAGHSFNIFKDQRGKPKPVDIPTLANISDGTDIGAYEFDLIGTIYYTVSGKITLAGNALKGVTLTFTNNGGTAVTSENGNYSKNLPAGWSGVVTPAKEGFTFNPLSQTYTSLTAHRTDQNYTALEVISPGLYLSPTDLSFSADIHGNCSGPQTVLIGSQGSGILNWIIASDVNWLSLTPSSGSGNTAAVTVTLDPAGLVEGTYTAIITVSDPNAFNSPQRLDVTLKVYDSTSPPFGTVDTPPDKAAVRSSVPVTGWVLDDLGVESVSIYLEQNRTLTFIGAGVLVEGARPDIEEAYPGYPGNSKAGWGYMMLTNALPNGGNGTFHFQVIATDLEGNAVTLGKKTLYCDNAHAVKPFGTLDTPAQGGLASGTGFVNFAWALTPQPNTIPTNGATIRVWVDGMLMGNPVYNNSREDIAALFPGYNNSNGAGGHFSLNTTVFRDGVHTIQWTVTDDAGNTEGIGSRYFTIRNSEGSSVQDIELSSLTLPPPLPAMTPTDFKDPVTVFLGHRADRKTKPLYPDDQGNINIAINPLQHLEVRLGKEGYRGYTLFGRQLRPLPIGSTLDSGRGIFYWQPGPGYSGMYHLIFIREGQAQDSHRKNLLISIYGPSIDGLSGHSASH